VSPPSRGTSVWATSARRPGRLDGIARIVQDVSDYDASTVSIDGMGLWILRRLELRIATTPRFRAEVGRADVVQRDRRAVGGTHEHVARRRSAVCRGDRDLGAHRPGARRADSAAARVRLGLGRDRGRRKVSARTRPSCPPPGASRRPWPLRVTDIDVVGHVNNAAYWPAIEDELARRGGRGVRSAAIEFRSGSTSRTRSTSSSPTETPHTASDTRAGFAAWLCVGDDVRASRRRARCPS